MNFYKKYIWENELNTAVRIPGTVHSDTGLPANLEHGHVTPNPRNLPFEILLLNVYA